MADHRIRVRVVGTSMAVECKDCVERLDGGYRQSWLVSELADLAHEHIEGTPAYGAESAVTSNDELVNLESRVGPGWASG